MKKLYKTSLALFVLVGIIVSCKEDEKVDPILGTWTVTYETTTNCIEPTDNHEVEISCTNLDCTTITFNKDGTIKVVVKNGGISNTQSGTYEITGNVIIITITGDFQDPGTYEITGNTLTVIVEETDTGCTKTLILKK